MDASREASGAALEQAVAKLKAGQTIAAISELEDWVRQHPADARAHEFLGAAYGMAGDLGSAASHLERALELNPHLAKACYNLGVVYERQGRFEDAIARMEKALRLAPDYEECRRHLKELVARRAAQTVRPPAAGSPSAQPRQEDVAARPAASPAWPPGHIPPATWDGSLGEAGPTRAVLLASDGGWTGHYGVERCPWWLDASILEGDLYLTLRNCGWRSGSVVLDHDGQIKRVRVSALILPPPLAVALGLWRGLLGGIAAGILWLAVFGAAFGAAAALRASFSTAGEGGEPHWLGTVFLVLLATGFVAAGALAGGVWGGMLGGSALGRSACRAMAAAALILLTGLAADPGPQTAAAAAIAGLAFGLLVGDFGLAVVSAVAWPLLALWIPGLVEGSLAEPLRTLAGPSYENLLSPAILSAVASPLALAVWGALAGTAVAPCLHRGIR
jgi:hypothetical protein